MINSILILSEKNLNEKTNHTDIQFTENILRKQNVTF